MRVSVCVYITYIEFVGDICRVRNDMRVNVCVYITYLEFVDDMCRVRNDMRVNVCVCTHIQSSWVICVEFVMMCA